MYFLHHRNFKYPTQISQIEVVRCVVGFIKGDLLEILVMVEILQPY